MLWLKNIVHSNNKIVIALKTSYNKEYSEPLGEENIYTKNLKN